MRDPVSAELPADIAELLGCPLYPDTADFPAELGYGWNTLAATENGNPLYWDDAVAGMLAGGSILPLSTLSLWMRPHRWAPGAAAEQVALKVHFDLKERLGLPEAIMSDNTIVFHEPVRPGDVISHRQVLKSVSGPKTTRLGSGRFWVIDVEYCNQHGELVGVESYTGFGYRRDGSAEVGQAKTGQTAAAAEPAAQTAPDEPRTQRTSRALREAEHPAAQTAPDEPRTRRTSRAHGEAEHPAAQTAPGEPGSAAKPDPAHDQVNVGDTLPVLTHHVTATTVVLGALASRDWRPMHHDHRFATERNGTRDIFLNTPNQLAWIERAVTDWTGPKGRLGRVSFRMHDPVFPGDTMTISSVVTAVPVDGSGCGWAELDLVLLGDDRTCTTGTARVALPMSAHDNPWQRRDEDWQP